MHTLAHFNNLSTIRSSSPTVLVRRLGSRRTSEMFLRGYFVILALILGLTSAAKIARLPKNLKRCHRNTSQDELNECLRLAIQDAHPKLKKGDPSINLQPIEPLSIPEIRVTQSDGPVNVNITQRNVKIYGVTEDITVHKAVMDFKNKVFFADIFYPRITAEADQIIDGKILLFPIQGDGKATMWLANYRCNFSVNFEEYEKNRYHYLRFSPKGIQYNFSVEKARFLMENLFNGDKQLGDATNQMFNENWQLIFKELRPVYEESFKQLLVTAVNQFFSKVPLEEIFLD